MKDRVAKHMLALTEPVIGGRLNKLRKLVWLRLGVDMLVHDPKIGGRFSALSNVGLIPAAIMGLDIAAVRRGAAEALAPIIDGAAPQDCPPAVGAALAVAFAETRDIAVNVLFAYSDRLERFTRWWVQLWSESLGKQGRGMTAVPALGPVDQHSALQLFLDGPADKFFTVVTTRSPRSRPAHRRGFGRRCRAAGIRRSNRGRPGGQPAARHGRDARSQRSAGAGPRRRPRRRATSRRPHDAFHAGDHPRRPSPRRRRLRSAGGGGGQGAGAQYLSEL
jgi:hypothetical protein